MPHPHPFAHAERDLVEHYMLHQISKIGHKNIVDIGGNPKRHYLYGKRIGQPRFGVNVWSVSPVIGRTDVFRSIDRDNFFSGVKDQ